MDQLLKDLRYALRTLAQRPAFTTVAVLTLALGIGATTAIFSVVRGVLLQPLPYDAPDRIVQIWSPWSNEPGVRIGRSPIGFADLVDAREAITSLERIAAYVPQSSVNLTGTEVPERVFVTSTTADLFYVLGSSAAVGRTFLVEEDTPGGNDVVVLSHALWQRRFGGDPSVLESVIRLDGVTHRIVGVMPPSFRMPADYAIGRPTEIWKPLGLDPGNLDRGNQWLHAVARLKPGAELGAANAELAALTQRWIEQGFMIRDLPPYYAVLIQDELFGGIRRSLLLLFGAVGFILLIACANVANLLLARADGRRTEMALRSALGASRSRLARQLLTESVLLALIGGAFGLLLAFVSVEMLAALNPPGIPRLEEIGLDPGTLGFTLIVALATAVLFGFVPALRAARQDLVSELKTDSRAATTGYARQRFRGGLVTAEVALAVILVVGATLMIRTFGELSRIDLGFDPGGVLTFEVALPGADYPEPQDRIRFHAQLIERLHTLPGVEGVGAARLLPLTARLGGGSIVVEGMAPPQPGEGLPNARWQVVTPGYFEAMRYGLAAGRFLGPADRADGMPAIVVNETMADMMSPGQTAVGRRVRNTNSDVPWFTVVGVVRDVRQSGVADTPSPTMYFTHEQVPLTRTFTPAAMSVAIRTTSNPLALVGAVRGVVRSLDPNLPVSGVRTMDDVVAAELAQSRFTMLLLALFAALALTLAMIGIYGLLSYAVSQRRHEMGIRAALGATRTSVFSLVIRDGMRLALAGLCVGLLTALFMTQLMDSMLYGVRPLDRATFLTVPILFVLTALAATFIPARRAMAVDPVLALRQQ
jgi:putative ABC transport system permease protein